MAWKPNSSPNPATQGDVLFAQAANEEAG